MSHIPDFERLQNLAVPEDFRDDPLPGWAGPGTLFGAPSVALEDLTEFSGWAVAGVPFDGTASSRAGAAEGPRAVRSASVVFANSLRSLGETEMLDTRTGNVFSYQAPLVVDAGDLHVYQTNTVRTFQGVASEAELLASRGESVLFLNGDHSCTFPTFAGFRAAQLAKDPSRRVGFINIDHHFDFGNWSTLHGALYHGSNSRRISELPGMRPEDIAFVGVGDVTKHDQFQFLLEQGFHVVPGAQIRRDGAAAALAAVLDALGSRCDVVYISLDIDVLDTSAASGTGHVTMGGIQIGELLDVYDVLRDLPVRALDITEIAPRYDPGGSTAQIAARLLFEYLFRTKQRGSGLAPWSVHPGHETPM